MDSMERYKIQESIKDVIRILDSAPIRPDMVWETNAIQITNRAPIAHLAIEKGLKALIADTSKVQAWGHSLKELHKRLGECDEEMAAYLSMAFDKTVSFYGFNPNSKGLGYLRSLDDYLSKVGTENAFQALRYWAIGESPKGDDPVPYIVPQVHRELLCALWRLFLPKRRWETILDRVERVVADAMCNRRGIVWLEGDVSREQSVDLYNNWLFQEHASACSALEEAVQKKFHVMDDEFVNQTLRDALEDLRRSEDPAVLYYVSTLAYLPKGSQLQDPEAITEVNWFRQDQTAGEVLTPAGTCLGFIQRFVNGGWGITPSEDGLVQVTEIAKTLKDARAYLVNRLTKPVIVTVAGESKRLRIVRKEDFFPPPNLTWDMSNLPHSSLGAATYELEFWDSSHGLSPGEEVWIELQSAVGEDMVSVLKGQVLKVSAQMVSIQGRDMLVTRETSGDVDDPAV